MSVEFRFDNGKYGRIMLGAEGFRKIRVDLNYSEDQPSAIEQYNESIYECENPLLVVSEKYLRYFSDIDGVSEYFLGMTYENLCTPTDCVGHYYSYPDVTEWDEQKIENLNWDMFLVTFYLFVFSTNNFSFSYYWKGLKQIFKAIQEDEKLFERLTLDRTENLEQHKEGFWYYIQREIYYNILKKCTDKSCWLAFCGIKEIKETFTEIDRDLYLDFEKKFCDIMDKIALDRMIENQKGPFKLIFESLDINNIFFYDEYFTLSSVSKEVKEKIKAMACERYIWAADLLIEKHQDYIAADELYAKALLYAPDNKIRLINEKRYQIVTKTLNQRGREKREKTAGEIKENFKTVFAVILLISLALCVIFALLTLVSWICSLNPLFKISWIGALSSLGLAVLFVILLACLV